MQQNQRVYMVDDDPAILRLLSTKLAKEGYEVRTFTDSQDALRAVMEDPPAFLITDWEMPGMNGLELCCRVRALELPNYVYVIILTSRAGQEELSAGFLHGADDFITKTHLDHSELIARLNAGARIIQLERRLIQMAHTDPLTGIMNRRSFFDVAAKEWDRSQRHHLPISFVIMDIDFFKRVNDNYGHAIGDALLCQTADMLQASCRKSETVCRYGGEEFCIMLPETNEEEAFVWAERFCGRFATEPFKHEDLKLGLTASFGISDKQDDRQNVEQLIDQADQALLAAKEAGRNRVVCYSSISASDHESTLVKGALAYMVAGMTAADVMTPVEHCLNKSDTVQDAIDFFLTIDKSPARSSISREAGRAAIGERIAERLESARGQRPDH